MKTNLSAIYSDLPQYIKQPLNYVYGTIPPSMRHGKTFWQTYQFIQKSQWESREKLEDYQMQLLNKLLNHAYENVPYYKKVFDERDLKPKDIKSTSDLKKLPLLTKNIIRERYSELVARNIRPSSYTPLHTSGSTGEVLKFLVPKNQDEYENAFIDRAFSSHGSRLYYERSIWLRSYVPENNAPIFYIAPELKRLYLSAYHLSANRINEYVKLINSYQAKLLVGYPSSLYILAYLLDEAHLKLNNIKIVHAGSEKMLPYWENKIKEILGVPVKDHYGMAERVSLFHRCSCSDIYHENLDYGLTEIINQADGCGMVVGTSFLNYAMPLIRYLTNDVARINFGNQLCKCGRGLPLTVLEFEGRSDDILITKDGRYIPGVNFYTMIYKIEGIKMFKIIQYALDTIELQIVPDDNFSDKSRDLIAKGIQERLGNVNLQINIVNEIQRSYNTGKIRCIETRVKTI